MHPADTTLDKLAALKPVFRAGGTVTAGQRVADERRRGRARAGVGRGAPRGPEPPPLARVVARATSGVEPHLYGIGPVDGGSHGAAPGPGWPGATSPPSS